MTYKVGQVLFVALKDKARIVPIQVVEEITKKTLTGDKVTYMVTAGTDGKVSNLSDIEGEIFVSPAQAQASLIDKATKHIMKVVNAAVEQAKQWYHVTPSEPEKVVVNTNSASLFAMMDEDDVTELPTEGTMITLPDGTKARVSLPDSMKS